MSLYINGAKIIPGSNMEIENNEVIGVADNLEGLVKGQTEDRVVTPPSS